MQNPSRTRRHLYTALFLGLLLLLAGAIPLQASYGSVALVLLLAAGILLAVPAGLGLTILELGALRRPALGTELHDELSMHNSIRAMAVGYVVLSASAGIALILTLFLSMPAVPALTAVLLLGVGAHAASFALFERRGDDGEG